MTLPPQDGSDLRYFVGLGLLALFSHDFLALVPRAAHLRFVIPLLLGPTSQVLVLFLPLSGHHSTSQKACFACASNREVSGGSSAAAMEEEAMVVEAASSVHMGEATSPIRRVLLVSAGASHSVALVCKPSRFYCHTFTADTLMGLLLRR